jgi:hypothetical protein
MIALVIIGLLLFGAWVFWLYAGTPEAKPGRTYRDKLTALTEQLKPPAVPPPSELFKVQGRDRFTRVTGDDGRHGPGTDLGPLPNGDGRVTTPNAPCWSCGQLKTPNHKCP